MMLTQPRHWSPNTLGGSLSYLDPKWWDCGPALAWPPHTYALCAYVLRQTGSYVHLLQTWPPEAAICSHPAGSNWIEWVENVAEGWREAVNSNAAAPTEVGELWQIVKKHSTQDLSHLRQNRECCCALLQLAAVADQASAGLGLPYPPVDEEEILRKGAQLLLGNELEGSSLTPDIPKQLARVLPKQHSPRGGLTLRSITHHLALHVGNEVTPFWYTVPRPSPGLNLLVAPWPLRIVPRQFQAADGMLHTMPDAFRCMEYKPEGDPDRVRRWTHALLDSAKRMSGRVDGVIFPEAALSDDEYHAVRRVVLDHGAFLIAGVLSRVSEGVARNLVVFDTELNGTAVHVEQSKHHRWRLDRSQIEMYGLGGTLDPSKQWWEHIEVDKREVHFIAFNEQTSVCCLVCEDLARQDPVAELVRSVGPNLVVALLMDAPQLGVRWPARYATVLADDPGCSVLTVTSAGMVDLTRTPRDRKPSRSIALWKDARADFVEVELPQGADGVLLSLCTEEVEEWTADGRSDGQATAYPRLGGAHAVWIAEDSRVPQSKRPIGRRSPLPVKPRKRR